MARIKRFIVQRAARDHDRRARHAPEGSHPRPGERIGSVSPTWLQMV